MTEDDAFALIARAAKTRSDQRGKPVRIAISGIEGTGKTTFAIKLVAYLVSLGRSADHVSIDGFHFKKDVRYRQGRDSADGYYEDAYDVAAFVKHVLERSQLEPPEYLPATHDLQTDDYLDLAPVKLSNDALLVTDGCYLFKPDFGDNWDLRIYLKTDFATALQRGAMRDAEQFGGFKAAKQKFLSRYHVASRRYISEVQPESVADLVFDNTDFSDLKLVQ